MQDWQDYVYVRKYMNGMWIARCVVYGIGSVCMYLLFLCVCTCILIARCLMFSLVYIHINARMVFVHCYCEGLCIYTMHIERILNYGSLYVRNMIRKTRTLFSELKREDY